MGTAEHYSCTTWKWETPKSTPCNYHPWKPSPESARNPDKGPLPTVTPFASLISSTTQRLLSDTFLLPQHVGQAFQSQRASIWPSTPCLPHGGDCDIHEPGTLGSRQALPLTPDSLNAAWWSRSLCYRAAMATQKRLSPSYRVPRGVTATLTALLSPCPAWSPFFSRPNLMTTNSQDVGSSRPA